MQIARRYYNNRAYQVARRAPGAAVAYGLYRYAPTVSRGLYGVARYAAGRAFRTGRKAYIQATTPAISGTGRVRPVRLLRKKKTLKGKVAELSRLANADTGLHIERIRNTYRTNAAVNSSSFDSFSCIDMDIIEGVLSHLRYYDPAAPSALVNASALTGSYSKDFYIDKAYVRGLVANNYQVPCYVNIYMMMPKSASSQDPDTAFQAGIADDGGVSANDIQIHPSDSDQLMKLWKIVKSKRKLLQPGQQLSLTHSVRKFRYDPSYYDSHTAQYNRLFGSVQFCVRVEGPLGHDVSVTTEQTSLQSTVDVETRTVFNVKYSAGANIKYIVSTNNGDSTFTNAGVVSEKPVADNISYSLS